MPTFALAKGLLRILSLMGSSLLKTDCIHINTDGQVSNTDLLD